MDSVNKNPDLPDVLNILIDAKDADLKLSAAEVTDTVAYNAALAPRFKRINTAVITNHPENTAFILLYESLSKGKRYRFKTFYLKENAVEWLKLQARSTKH